MDSLKYKEEGLAEAKERFRAFWEGEIIDRVCLAVTAPRDRETQVPESVWEAETDPEVVVRRFNAAMSNTYYGGEALPMAYAPGNLLYAAYGGIGSFASRTVWVDPSIHSAEEWDGYRFDPENRFVQDVLKITEALSEDSAGKYLVGSPGIFGCLDAMALMRGMADFVVELILPEHAEPIHKAHQACLEGFKYISEAVYEAASGHQEGFLNHPALWAPGRINNWSADFCCLIGPKAFRQWMMPELEEMARLFEFNMYHFDGPNAVHHLPMILEIQQLKGIQYTPGAGQGLAEAMPVYKEIQRGGRVQWVWVAYDEVETVLQELDPRGLLIFTHAPSVEAAEELLKKAERWSADG